VRGRVVMIGGDGGPPPTSWGPRETGGTSSPLLLYDPSSAAAIPHPLFRGCRTRADARGGVSPGHPEVDFCGDHRCPTRAPLGYTESEPARSSLMAKRTQASLSAHRACCCGAAGRQNPHLRRCRSLSGPGHSPLRPSHQLPYVRAVAIPRSFGG
jgi:hypothetical protein